MIDIIVDTIIDVLKLIPFLFVAFLLIEVLEHKLTSKNKNIITKSKKFGPVIGSLLGIIPQCGFSVMGTNLYITRIISLGTLFSIYLSTSDEMLPILISEKANIKIILQIILTKIFFGMFYGILIDLILRKRKKKQDKTNYEICDKEHCHCEKGILISSIKHTLNIVVFLFITTFIINIVFHYVGEDYLSKVLLKGTILGPFITSLIGLIPNCGASIILTELYLNNAISLSSLIAGLLTGSGTALIVLFKENKNIKIVYCQAELFGKMHGKWTLPPYSLETILGRNCIFCTAIYSREDFDKTKGYNSNMKYGFEDWDFWLSIIELNPHCEVHQINEVLFYYRIRKRSMARQLDAKKYDYLRKQIWLNHRHLYASYFYSPTDSFEYTQIINSLEYKLGKLLITPIKKVLNLFS